MTARVHSGPAHEGPFKSSVTNKRPAHHFSLRGICVDDVTALLETLIVLSTAYFTLSYRQNLARIRYSRLLVCLCCLLTSLKMSFWTQEKSVSRFPPQTLLPFALPVMLSCHQTVTMNERWHRSVYEGPFEADVTASATDGPLRLSSQAPKSCALLQKPETNVLDIHREQAASTLTSTVPTHVWN